MKQLNENETLESIEIPVLLDDFKDFENLKMSRFTYFTIECDEPSLGWELELKEARIPICLIGLSAIAWRPIDERFHEFKNLQLIDDLFNTIEEDGNLFIESEEIWFPNYMFSKFSKNRGDVFRVKLDLFNLAFRYQSGKIEMKEYISKADRFINGIRLSEEETAAFRNWSNEQVSVAKEIYPKNKELEIKWRE